MYSLDRSAAKELRVVEGGVVVVVEDGVVAGGAVVAGADDALVVGSGFVSLMSIPITDIVGSQFKFFHRKP